MQKRRLAALLVGAAFVTATAADARELRLGHNAALENPRQAGALRFKERLEELSMAR